MPRASLELLRNAAYWDPKRVPKADRIVLVVAPDTVTRTNALLTGQVDFIETPAPDLVPRLKQSGMRIVENVTPHVWEYHLSLLEGLALARHPAAPRGQPGDQPRRRGRADERPGQAGQRRGRSLLPLVRQAAVPGEVRPGRGAQAARGSRVLQGQPATDQVPGGHGGSGQMLSMPMNEYIQSAWREVGIEVEFQAVELEVLYTCWRQGAAGEIAKAGGITANNVAYVTSDPLYALIRFFHSKQVAPTGVNWSHYSDPETDRLIDTALSTFDPAEVDQLMARVHERVVDQALLVFVVHDTNPHVMGKAVRGYTQAQHWFQDLTTLG
ncbi:ABC transporter substrate-binding protein [Dankookia sp. P2]|uniref:ABC transporter substrate-binding protein n=1 Tax=Dankookia sp. P2 TaxID=3423955 RepID=UPI003D66F879